MNNRQNNVIVSDSSNNDKQSLQRQQQSAKKDRRNIIRCLFQRGGWRVNKIVVLFFASSLLCIYMGFVSTEGMTFATSYSNAIQNATTTSIENHSCPSIDFENDPKYESNKEFYGVFFEMIDVFNEIQCPYMITAGTLLGFVRECRLWADLDFAIPLTWWKEPTNALALKEAMEKRGGYQKRWPPEVQFGKPGHAGYEEAWVKQGVGVDFFSILIDENDNYFVSSMWINNILYPCVIRRTGVQELTWGNKAIRAPFPVNSVLTSYYGKDWRVPFQGEWIWDYHPFSIGSCTKDEALKQKILRSAKV